MSAVNCELDVFDLLDDFTLLRILELSDSYNLYVPRLVCRRWAWVYRKRDVSSFDDSFRSIARCDDIVYFRLTSELFSEKIFYKCCLTSRRPKGFCTCQLAPVHCDCFRIHGKCRTFLFERLCDWCQRLLNGRICSVVDMLRVGEIITQTRHNRCFKIFLAIENYSILYRARFELLSYVVGFGNEEMLRFSFDYYGADVIAEIKKSTASDLCRDAARNENVVILSYLLREGFPVYEETIWTAANIGNTRIASMILYARPDLIHNHTPEYIKNLIGYTRSNSNHFKREAMMKLLKSTYGKKTITQYAPYNFGTRRLRRP